MAYITGKLFLLSNAPAFIKNNIEHIESSTRIQNYIPWIPLAQRFLFDHDNNEWLTNYYTEIDNWLLSEGAVLGETVLIKKV